MGGWVLIARIMSLLHSFYFDRTSFKMSVTMWWITSPATLLVATSATTMSPQAAYDLSIAELLCVLNEKLGLELARVQGIRPPPVVSGASLETNVSTS